MKKTYLIMILSITLSIIINIGNLIVTIVTKDLIDTPNFKFVIILGIIWILSSLIILIKNYIIQAYYLKNRQIYMSSLLKAIFLFPFSFLETKKYNDELSKIKDKPLQEKDFINSVDNISNAVFGIIGLYIILISKISFYLLILLSILLFIFVLLSCIISGKLSVLMYDYWQNYIKNTRKYNYISDVLSRKEYIEEKKVYNYLSFFSNCFNNEFDIATKKNRHLGIKRIKLEIITDIIFLFYSIIAFLILFFAYRQNQISIGLFVSITGYMVTLWGNVSIAIASFEHITKYRQIENDTIQFFKNKENNKNNIKMTSLDINKYILNINNVTFKYPMNDMVTLNNINVSFEKGKKYAIVGTNGSGKTTLAKIIAGLYSPVSGTVYYETQPVVLFQDFNRYPATLKENIILSDNFDKKYDKLFYSIKEQSGIKRRVDLMKFGDNTELTNIKENGEELSGGEWQRIALARILWNDSDIYILDEPTASLDPLEEIRIFKLYNELLDKKTVIFITHRLGYVKYVDEVIVLNSGNIVEQGTHEKLIEKKDGLYKKMFEEQRVWYE